jgi:hypothetical protein
MKKNIMVTALLSLVLAGCGKDEPATQDTAQVEASTPVQPKLPDHYYVMQDGEEYGYSRALSKDQKNAGQAATSLMMFRYAGQRNGKYQLHVTDGINIMAAECSNPCEYIKTMSFMDADYLRNKISIERLQNAPDSIIHFAFEDAFAGKMQPYAVKRGGKDVQMWVTDKGPQYFPLEKSS